MTYINLFVTLADIVFFDGHCWEAMIQVAQCCMTVDPKHTSGNLYRPQRSWAKVIFSQACVKNSVHRGGEGVCLSACWDTNPNPPRADTPPGPGTPLQGADTPPWSRHPLGADTPPRSRHPLEPGTPPGSRLQHTVNERPVRILLECILIRK